jgi:hypothetical protein
MVMAGFPLCVCISGLLVGSLVEQSLERLTEAVQADADDEQNERDRQRGFTRAPVGPDAIANTTSRIPATPSTPPRTARRLQQIAISHTSPTAITAPPAASAPVIPGRLQRAGIRERPR